MELLSRRIQTIKEALRQGETIRAASLMISAVASDEMFGYWAACCMGSEKIPKILKYIRHISFDRDVPTAQVNFMEGNLRVGVGFFMEHIEGPEDLLFILIHERNHLILRRLYPNVFPLEGCPKELFNFGEDAFINSVSRRYLPSTLPERFYRSPTSLLLTAMNSRIDWELFSLDDDRGGRMKEAHGAIYRENHFLLRAIGEAAQAGACSGYGEWMRLIGEWHAQMEERGSQKRLSLRGMIGGEVESQGHLDTSTPPEVSDESKDEGQEEPEDECGEDHEGSPKEKGEGVRQGEHEETAETKDRAGAEDEQRPFGQEQDVEYDEGDEGDQTESQPGVDRERDINAILRGIIPLVRTENGPAQSTEQESRDPKTGLSRIPMQHLKPNDLEVKLIMETCEILEFRDPVRVLEGGALAHVDGLIRGILSDRATERSYDGYSLSVPLSVTRRDAFALSSGEPPVIWQRRVGVENPFIDLYVDVSGSMRPYYIFIPHIYEALKHVIGRIFQFSTVVVETDCNDRFLHSTGGTDFDCVADHMIREGVRAAILLSDGEAKISEPRRQALKSQIESLVYIKTHENEHRNWEHLATQIVNFKGGEK